MKVAVIDMGTNTFHLMLANVTEDGYDIVQKERLPVRIGEKGINKGEITKEAWKRAIDALLKFNSTISDNNITQVFATATSAIRNASNGKLLVSEIKEQTGIEVTVISGQREAELILEGVRNALDLGGENHLIMDIGGGSIEFIIANQKNTSWLKSFEIGGQRLVERFHDNDPITETEIETIHSYFDKELGELIDQCHQLQPKTLVGCSGTFDTLSEIHMTKNGGSVDHSQTELPLPIDAFESIAKEIIEKNRPERLAIPGMIEMRVDMIVVACILIQYLLDKLAIEQLRVSSYALKEGVLVNSLNKAVGKSN